MKNNFAGKGDVTRTQGKQAARVDGYVAAQQLRGSTYSGSAMPGGRWSPSHTNPYFDKLNAQYRILNKIVDAGDRAQEAGNKANALYKMLDAALEEGKEEKAQRIAKRINKAKREQRRAKVDKVRFANDYAAEWDVVKTGLTVVAGIGLFVGAYGLYSAFNAHNTSTIKAKPTPYEKPTDHIYHAADDGTLYENGTPIAKNDIIAKVSEKILFSEKQINDADKLLKDKYASRGIDLFFGKDGSLKVHTQSDDGTIQINNVISAKDVHKNIFSAIAGKDSYKNQMDYVFMPPLKVNGTESDFYVDDSFEQDIKNITGELPFGVTSVNVIKIKYDADGNMHAIAGNVDKNGKNFTPVKELDATQAKSAAGLLADGNKNDVDKPVDKLLDDMKHNSIIVANGAYKDAMKKHDDFLKKYNVSTDDKMDVMLQGLEKYQKDAENFFHTYNKKNISDMDKMIKDLQNLNNTRTKLLKDWNANNESELDNMIHGLNKYIKDLENNWSKANSTHKKEIEGWMDKVNGTVTEYTNYLQENKTKYENMIGTLNAKIKEVASCFNTTNMVKNLRSTEAVETAENMTEQSKIPKYLLDLTDATQLALAKKMFGETAVGEWISPGMNVTQLRIFDTVNDQNGAATVSPFKAGRLVYTEAVLPETFEPNKDELKPYEYHVHE